MNDNRTRNHRPTPTGRSVLAIAALVPLTLSGSAALAHHGDSGEYDSSTPIVLAGTVAEATFAPPHPVLSVEVASEDMDLSAEEVGRPDDYTGPFVVRPDDAGQVLEVELPPVGEFYGLEEQIEIGDRVVVLALRNCLPPNELRSSWLRLPDGGAVSYTGDWAGLVDGCR